MLVSGGQRDDDGFGTTNTTMGGYNLWHVIRSMEKSTCTEQQIHLPYLLDKKGESVRVCRPTFFRVKYLLKLINSNSESYSKQYRNII